MLKERILIAALILLLPLTASARVIPYVSLDGGFSNGHWPLTDDSRTRTNFSATGAIGGASIGLGSALTSYLWFAVEAFGNFSAERSATKNITYNSASTTARMRLRYSYGLSIIPGLLLSDKGLLYLRLGALQSRFELQQENHPTTTTSSSTDSGLQEAGLLGAGLQASIGNNWSVRAEYDRILYRHFSQFTNHISPIDNQVRFGLLYSFI